MISSHLTVLNMRLANCNVTSELIDAGFDQLTRLIHSTASTLPRSKFVKHIKPFWNDSLNKLKQAKVLSYRLWVAACRPRDRDNALFIDYKCTKKKFAETLKAVRKNFENDKILEAVRTAELNKNAFWKLIQRAKGSVSVRATAIRDQDLKVVHEITDVLRVWKLHFENLGVPKNSAHFDEIHYNKVNIVSS